MANTLFVIPGSHPCIAVRTALERKGIAYRRIDLVPGVQRLVGPLAYGARTVPGMRLAGERIGGSTAILHRLDELVSEPRMYAVDPAQAQAVEAVEAWADTNLQSLARRLAIGIMRRRPAAMDSFSADSKLGVPGWMARASAPLVARLMVALNDVTEANIRADLEALPGQLDRIDAWIAEGTIGGVSPNAADLQLGAALQLLDKLGDVAPLLAGRPARRLIDAVIDVPGSAPAGVLPADWLPAS